ncbi:hypothetical protein [Vibrio parahaemolyticus]|uniref:hypothetical protein n=1 Tax=Vibrio parahaemolyticus TaxID=670 RepID=UPI001123D514|nr:hypothetical protein [Vibrio parahaemolyticus]TOO92131.1 hypothetical protein CGH25_22320 [Vibrio parahaemolyticus]TOO98430.1 hypothetical protein CGH24_20035 [Vibrio parahaemolyticus]TOQ68383.1 hypothetical protein CGG89_20485 [Vibrio parahaemolyticus]
MDKGEYAVNLWAFVDIDTKLIYSISGRAYFLSGDEDKKLQLLKMLARSDFMGAHRAKVPSQFYVDNGTASRCRNVTTVAGFYQHEAELFASLINDIEHSLPPLMIAHDRKIVETPQSLPNDLLRVVTLVSEDSEGYYRAIITEEDVEWLQNELAFKRARRFKKIKPEVQSYFYSHINEQKAKNESELFADPPISFDLCGTELEHEKYFVDGSLRNQRLWAFMCSDCFSTQGKGVGWGVGQLYRNEGKNRWLLVAGFNDD